MSLKEVLKNQLDQMILRVIDSNGVRTLWLDDTAQSQMLLATPQQLITPYEQAMACWSLFMPAVDQTKQALVLGLGGGSATKHLCHYYPEWTITAIEYSDQLAAVAYQYFNLPKSDNLTVMVDDAFSVVAQPSRLDQPAYDLLLVDLFEVSQQTTYRYPQQFWVDCLRLMVKDSVLVINLWADHEADFKSVLHDIGELFHWRVLLLPIDASSNVVLFVFHPEGKNYHLSTLQTRAASNAARMQLPMPDYLHALIQHNQAQLSRCIAMDD